MFIVGAWAVACATALDYRARMTPTGDTEYEDLEQQLRGLLGGESDMIANAANTAAVMMQGLADLNWAGFYFAEPDGSLRLGPFQGKPACTRIGLGQGVCGAAAARRQTMRVDDVHTFPGHIACDAASRSEMVVPLTRAGGLLGVLDLDSRVRRGSRHAIRLG